MRSSRCIDVVTRAKQLSATVYVCIFHALVGSAQAAVLLPLLADLLPDQDLRQSLLVCV